MLSFSWMLGFRRSCRLLLQITPVQVRLSIASVCGEVRQTRESWLQISLLETADCEVSPHQSPQYWAEGWMVM